MQAKLASHLWCSCLRGLSAGIWDMILRWLLLIIILSTIWNTREGNLHAELSRSGWLVAMPVRDFLSCGHWSGKPHLEYRWYCFLGWALGWRKRREWLHAGMHSFTALLPDSGWHDVTSSLKFPSPGYPRNDDGLWCELWAWESHGSSRKETEAESVLAYCVQLPGIFDNCGKRTRQADSSAVTSIYRSCTGPEFRSQHPWWEDHTACNSSSRGSISASSAFLCTHAHLPPTHTHTQTYTKSKWNILI